MRPITALCLLMLLAPWTCLAQPREPLQPTERLVQPPPPIVLLVRMGGITKPLDISKVDVDVTVLGSIAETRTTVTFYNPNTRAMAGDLYFPLPEGATVTGYALDIEGRMVDGVVVPKDKGRQVYEQEVRKGVDPGLVEWVTGNNFKTRVFPIPPQGTRTVMVRYLTGLRSDPSGAAYELPLNFQEKIADFHLRLEVIHSEVAPVVVKGGPANLQFTAGRESYVAEVTSKDSSLTDSLVVMVPQPMQSWTRTQKSADGTTYFDVTDTVAAPAGVEKNRIEPEHLVVLWDDSGSRSGKPHEAEFALLKEYFQQLRKESVKVDVVLFSNAVDEEKSFTVKDGDTGDLLKYLKQVDYDGGTQLSAITPKPSVKADLYLLFSDGLSNFGSETAGGFKAPVYAFSGDATANHPALRHIATQTGGAYFNLARVTQAEAAAAIGSTQFSLLDIKVVDGQVLDLLPSGVRPVTAPLHVSGTLASESATLEVTYGMAGKVLETRRYTLRSGAASQGETLRIWWAQQRIDELVTQAEKNRDELLTLGRIHGLVTPETSLIVLENLEQYVQHGIVPPATLPELRAAYFEELRQRDKGVAEEKQAKIGTVLEKWNKRMEWWKREFDYPKNFKYKDPDSEEGVIRGMGGGGAVRVTGHAEVRMMTVGSSPSADTRPEPMEEDQGAAEQRAQEEREKEQLAQEEDAKKRLSKERDGQGDDDERQTGPTIEVKLSDPDTPYMKKLKQASGSKGGLYRAYMKQREEYASSPSFFLDCADYFFSKGFKKEGLRILTNIAEMKLDDPALFRILGHRLEQQEMLDLSAEVFRLVLRLRPEEPQSYRDLGLVLGRLGQYPEAISLLYKVVVSKWDRFEEIEIPVLMEMNRLIAKANKEDLQKLDLDARLIHLLDVDIRIVLTWDSDMTDMDIWVTEPSGEKAKYDHAETTIGGLVSKDFTDGYGPEEYLVHKALRGKYTIEANYYGESAPTVAGTVTVQAEVYTNFGRPNEQRRALTLRLEKKKDVVGIGEITF